MGNSNRRFSRIIEATLFALIGLGMAGPGQAQDGAATAPPATEAAWSWAPLGSWIGMSGIVTASNDGATEIYVGGGNNLLWQALRYDAGRKDYVPTFVSPPYKLPIVRIANARLGTPASLRIVVALADGTLELYDQATKTHLGTWQDPCAGHSGISGFATADLNGDGLDEIISSCSDNALFAYGMAYAAWAIPNVGGKEIVVGQMDNDPALEIASTSGVVVDAGTHNVEWSNSSGFGAHLRAADIDGDGRQELIAADAWYLIRSYDVERQLIKWSIPSSHDIGAIFVADVDKDGVQELLVGDGQWGSIHAYSTVTRVEEWSIANPEHGVTNITSADVNNDGQMEVLWGAGATSSGSDHLYVANWQTRAITWQNLHLDAPFAGPQLADLDGDGSPELVTASFRSESGYSSGRIVVIDPRSRQVRAISPAVAGGQGSTGLHDLKLRDINGDGRPEILIATDRLYDGVIEAYNFSAGNDFNLVWTNAERPTGSPFYSIEAADTDGDGVVEIVAGGGREHTGAEGVYLYVYDVATRLVKWHSPQLGAYWSRINAVAVADLNGDGRVEVMGTSLGGLTYIFDGVTQELQANIADGGNSMDVLRAPGLTALMVGKQSGELGLYAVLNGGLSEIGSWPVGEAAIDGVGQLGPESAWYSTGGSFKVIALDGTPLFRSENYGTDVSRRNLVALPGAPWLFSSDPSGVRGFDLSNAISPRSAGH